MGVFSGSADSKGVSVAGRSPHAGRTSCRQGLDPAILKARLRDLRGMVDYGRFAGHN
jgi:hypothetical protein